MRYQVLAAAGIAATARAAKPWLVYASGYGSNVRVFDIGAAISAPCDAKPVKLEPLDQNNDCGKNPSWLDIDAARNLLYCVYEDWDGAGGKLTPLRINEADGKLKTLKAAPLATGPVHSVLFGDKNQSMIVSNL